MFSRDGAHAGGSCTQAQFSNASVLQIFVEAPLTDKATMGVLVPPLVLPHMHVDMQGLAIGARLLEANGASSTKLPKGDDLAATHDYCSAVHQGVSSMIAGSRHQMS